MYIEIERKLFHIALLTVPCHSIMQSGVVHLFFLFKTVEVLDEAKVD